MGDEMREMRRHNEVRSRRQRLADQRRLQRRQALRDGRAGADGQPRRRDGAGSVRLDDARRP